MAFLAELRRTVHESTTPRPMFLFVLFFFFFFFFGSGKCARIACLALCFALFVFVVLLFRSSMAAVCSVWH